MACWEVPVGGCRQSQAASPGVVLVLLVGCKARALEAPASLSASCCSQTRVGTECLQLPQLSRVGSVGCANVPDETRGCFERNRSV